MDKVSVIIPVYRAEQYIEACVRSVAEQSYSNLEILLVDDGSPDCSGEICDKLAGVDKRIRVIHKSNGGASSARNAGLKYAGGTYICFVDSDDVLPANAIEMLVRTMISTESEYAAGICGIMGSSRVKNQIDREKVIRFDEQPEDLLSYIVQGGSYSPYAKLYLRSIIDDNKLAFREDLKCSEDALFIRQYLKYCKNAVLVPSVVYMYNTGNENSLSKKGFPEYANYFIEKLIALKELVSKLPLDNRKKVCFLESRGVHGLRLSIRHYIKNFSNHEEQISFISKSLTLFAPWLPTGENSYLERNKDLSKWWTENQLNIRNEDVHRLMEYEYSIQKKVHWRALLKKLIKRCFGK